jgi:hypothetical protein
MSIATLLNIPDHPAGRNAFSFEHAMAHREYMAVMGPLDQWTLMPYFIDPAQYQSRPATKWPLNHQQAHNDFTTYLPADASALVAGIPSSQILLESDLNQPDSRTWWTFVNHQEHLTANEAILPIPDQDQPPPWWVQPPRRALVFW